VEDNAAYPHGGEAKDNAPCCHGSGLKMTLHIAMVSWRTVMPGNNMRVQQTTAARITKMVQWKTATPIAKVVLQTMLPRISVVVRPKMTPPIAMVARSETTLHISMVAQLKVMLRNAILLLL
jgi:hypothetical protein